MESWAVMVVLIVLISVGSGVVRSVIKARYQGGGPELQELRARVEALEGIEERVRTLESIVTDPRHQLDREIRGLEEGRT